MDPIVSWIAAGLIAAFLWAVTNLLDQIVIRKFYPDQALSLTAINSLLQSIPFIILVGLSPQILQTDFTVILILIGTAILNMTGFLTYYKAIKKEEELSYIEIMTQRLENLEEETLEKYSK